MPLLRSILPALAAACLFAPAAYACPNADVVPNAAASADAVVATVCLMNAERTSRGLGVLTTDSQLEAAALAHAQDMVQRDYFAHDSPNGGTLTDRLRTAGWLPSGASWTAGENIAWGEGSLSTPRHTVSAWMASAGHRENLLDADFDEVGLGLVPDAPGNHQLAAATYVADYGAREGSRPAGAGSAPIVVDDGGPASKPAPVATPRTKPSTKRKKARRCGRSARRSAKRCKRRVAQLRARIDTASTRAHLPL